MLTVVRRSEHLIESLLLSTSDQRLEHYADVPLHDVVRQVLAEVKTDDPRLTAKIEPVTVRGDSILLAHLVGNLQNPSPDSWNPSNAARPAATRPAKESASAWP
ncbi:hypothetical protein [Streptomyces sp. 135]|nr:hypothetical protein [Streptomyces sp. 135]